MKMIMGILAFCCVVITICIVFLLRSGVSLHAAPYIKPSIITADYQNIPKGIFLRLFPDLQSNHYVLWGLDWQKPEEQKMLLDVKTRLEEDMKRPVNIISEGEAAEPNLVRDCPAPCWIILPAGKAHELEPNAWIDKHRSSLQQDYITITWLNFHRNTPVSEECLHMKILNFACIQVLPVQAVERSMKEKNQRYFFMQKYQDRDHFLFVEEAVPQG